MSLHFLHFSKTTASSTLLFSTTVFLTPFLRSSLNNTVAKTFSSLLFQFPHLFFLQSENTRNNQSYFPILLTTSHYFVDSWTFAFKTQAPNLHSRGLPETLFQLSPQFFYPNILFSRPVILCASYVSLLILILKKPQPKRSSLFNNTI